MKRVEVRLAVPVVAPLLDVIRGLGERPAPPPPWTAQGGGDAELEAVWSRELVESGRAEIAALLALFDEEFFREGRVAFDADNAETILRACAAVRLRLREVPLAPLGDEALESGAIDAGSMDPERRKALACFLFLATIQELIIQHLEEGILGA